MDFVIIKVIMAIVNIQEDNMRHKAYFDCGKLSTSGSKCPTGPLQKKVP